ncbi:MAG: hypothetical protein R3C05_08545 [Pirellulaceae bacterium]
MRCTTCSARSATDRRVQQGVSNDQPYIGSIVAKHKPSKRNLVSNAWLIKCVGPPVFCAPNIDLGGYPAQPMPLRSSAREEPPRNGNFEPPEIHNPYDRNRLAQRRQLLDN